MPQSNEHLPEVAALEESIFELEYAVWELEEVRRTQGDDAAGEALGRLERANQVLEDARQAAGKRLSQFQKLDALMGEREDVARLYKRLCELLDQK